jgi:hypothetical protein
MTTRRPRTEILAAVLAAFSGIQGNLTEREWNYGIAVVETEFDGDLQAVERALREELAACALACRVTEKG